ncbi:FAD-dependent oxidoreductase [Rathayibacter sp. YIM 133350]|uniref:FAD-dependent oxidoreductase n=1 Tax=Rathayibacter sp. YIM 133350 TaxID=3131992 RepID=UPI00307EA4B2
MPQERSARESRASRPDSEAPAPRELSAEVCIVGGGPAGVMLGLLLARAGIDVVVLEKHGDFFRDFRGDTVHPSTLDLIDQLGLRLGFERIPHVSLPRLDAVIDGIRLHAIDFSSLPAPNREVTLMPQWDLLDLLADAARATGCFRLVMQAEATDVLRSGGRVAGVQARTPDGELRVRAPVTIAADGRASSVRRALGLPLRDYGVPIDVTWFRLPRPTRPLPDTLANVRAGTVLITIPRPGYLQCGLLIAKGSYDQVRSAGLPAFRARIAAAAPRLAEVAGELHDWDDVKLLSVQIDRLRRWWVPGVLCIGDAAHAMSPVFGVGINYAIQDAVATANLLVPLLRSGGGEPKAVDAVFAAVQRRRNPPTALMQRVQRAVHRLVGRATVGVLLHNPPTRFERAVIAVMLPIARPLAARLVGYGFRPERIAPGLLR